MTPQNPARGMIIMTLAMLLLPALDVFAKLLGETMATGQIVWYRFFVQCLIVWPVVFWLGCWRPVAGTLMLQFYRGVLLALATLFFFAALRFLPLADAISIFFVEPMILTLLSVLFLGEVIRIRRLTAICLGFIGAMIVIRPSFDAVGTAALLPLGTAVSFAGYMVITRRIAPVVDPFQMQAMVGATALLVMTIALGFGVLLDIAVLTPKLPAGIEIPWVMALGSIAMLGHLLIVIAMRHAPASLLAPLQYVEIIGATVFGYWVFSDIPDTETIIGAGLIVTSGLYLFHRETIRRKTDSEAGRG